MTDLDSAPLSCTINRSIENAAKALSADMTIQNVAIIPISLGPSSLAYIAVRTKAHAWATNCPEAMIAPPLATLLLVIKPDNFV